MQAQTFSIKTKLYTMNLKHHKHNILEFHLNLDDKIDTLNVRKPPADKDISISLFKAYDTSDNALFKGTFVSSSLGFFHQSQRRHAQNYLKNLMLKIEAKYDKLCIKNKWKLAKKEDDASIIASTLC
jgi:hypothetical protein